MAKKLYPTAQNRADTPEPHSQTFLNGMAYAAHELSLVANILDPPC
jgi:hypothetical protein